MKGSILLIIFMIGCIAGLYAQKIEISPAQKMVGKYDDYEVLGKNSIGTIVHYYSKSGSKIQVYNSKMRPFNDVDLDILEKRSHIEKVLLSDDLILVFYSVLGNNQKYLKLKRINYRLDTSKEGVLLDSINHNALSTNEGFYIKPSRNENYFVAFSFEDKQNRMMVHYTLMDKQLNVVKTGNVLTEDRGNMTLESVKVNNHGDILVTIGHLNRRTSSESDYSFSKFTTHYIGLSSEKPNPTTISDEGFLYKDLVTNWNEEDRSVILVGTYRRIKEEEDIGVFYASIKEGNSPIPYRKMAFIEEDFEGSNAPYRKWKHNAEIQIPKRIIPRSDGGFIYLLEAEYHEYQVLSGPTSTTNFPSYPQYENYYDENYYYDIKAVSVNPNGEIDWKANLPKNQETDNDLGRYSSYFYFGSNNITKLLFVDDIYANGNFTEFNINPNGQWSKNVILNSYQDDLLLVPKKAKQTLGDEVIIPSEKKNKMRLVKITF